MGLRIDDLSITAAEFGFGERIPDRHSADGGNVGPELRLAGAPADAVELAVVVHDPDAPLPRGFTHFVGYGIDPSTSVLRLSETDTYRVGPNTVGVQAYGGPQPPAGHGTHHYYFWVYALDTKVSGEPSREEFLADYAQHIVEQNRHIGTYSA